MRSSNSRVIQLVCDRDRDLEKKTLATDPGGFRHFEKMKRARMAIFPVSEARSRHRVSLIGCSVQASGRTSFRDKDRRRNTYTNSQACGQDPNTIRMFLYRPLHAHELINADSQSHCSPLQTGLCSNSSCNLQLWCLHPEHLDVYSLMADHSGGPDEFFNFRRNNSGRALPPPPGAGRVATNCRLAGRGGPDFQQQPHPR